MPTYLQKEPVIIEEAEIGENPFSFQILLSRLVSIWPWLIGSVIICLGLAFTYLVSSNPVYKVHSSILVEDDKKGADFGDAGLLQDFGLLAGKSNVDNEAEILKSRSLMEHVVQALQLHISFAVPGRFKTQEIYNSRPVNIHFIDDPKDTLTAPLQYILAFDKPGEKTFTLSNGQKTYHGQFGDTLRLKEGIISISPATGFASWPSGQQLYINIDSFESIVQAYLGALSVEIPNKQVSVIYLTLNQVLPEKGEHILNTLVSAYLQGNIDNKNRIADSTIRFIDDRLVLVSGELSGIEKDIEGFKTANQLTDISEQSKAILANSSEYSRLQTGQEVQLSVVQELEKYLKDNQNNTRVVPSSLVMQDPGFITLITRYNESQLQRDKMLMSLTPKHPFVITADEQLRNIRLDLMSSISSIRKGIQVGINELKKKGNVFQGEMSKVPAKERIFLDYSRQQAIKQELYVFLLKKREETAISKTSTVANARIIDNAKSENKPFAPKKAMIMMAGLIAGILIPFGVSIGKDALTNRVNTLKDITANTHVPVLAEIGRNYESTAVAVTPHSRELIAEQFRSLRTNLQFLLTGKNDKTIMVTSSMSGEGKSFLSTNLSMVLALAGKKVILMEMDLRKPKITVGLNLQKTGFTNYIISHENDWAKWVQPSGVHENFFVLGAGPVPPNPTELLMLPETKQLFEELKQHYDYLIIDTPPAGLVTDAEIIAKHVDVTLYVTRHQITFKPQIQLIEKFYLKKTMPRMNIIINDVMFKKAGYGLSYRYGYGYGNYGNEGKKS